ncbi:radical SAM family heme chaperone HemW [Spirochaetota bacterium]
MNYGIYVHFPFCHSKCDYCSFFSVSMKDGNIVEDYVQHYVERLKREIDERLKSFDDIEIDTIYFGGGSPSILNDAQVSYILNSIKRNSSITENCEISMEFNPQHVSPEALENLKKTGVNRFTLGVQTLNKKLHEQIGRSSRPCSEDVLEMFFGIDDITHCIDLITGIPGQSIDELTGELKHIVQYNPRHISVYLLSIEKNTALAGRMRADESYENKQRLALEKTMKLLQGEGYDHYEISNYAMKGYESMHNMKYWKFFPYIGFGPGAHSFYNNERSFNAMTIDDYIISNEVTLTIDKRDENSNVVEYFLTGLRLINGFSIGEMERRLKLKLSPLIMEKIEYMARDGLVIFDSNNNGNLRLTERGLFLADSVIYKIVEPIIN